MTNYEMALSEIEAYKKAHESLSENLEYANKQTQQYKTERDTCLEDIEKLRERNKELERQNAEQLALLKQFRKLIDYKLTLHQGSSMYREYRSKLDQLGVK